MTTGTAMVQRTGSAVAIQEFDEAKIELIRNAIMPGANAAELEVFVEYCRRTGLSPFTRQIWAIPVWDSKANRRRYEFHTGVDGLRLIAARTGEYDGMDGPYFKAQGGEWDLLWEDDKEPPFAAKVTVYRRGKPWTHVAKWREFARKDRQGRYIGMWGTHPSHALGIRTEGHALRRAFPQETSGLYLDEQARPPRYIQNPDAPASQSQLGRMHQLSATLGWSDDERHERAGVASFRDLTKGRASELIDEWSALTDTEVEDGEIVEHIQAEDGDESPPPVEEHPEAEGQDVGDPAGSGTGGSPPAEPERSEPSAPDAPLEGPATDEQWKRAVALCGSRAKVTFMAHDLFGIINSADDITADQMAELIRTKAGA